MNILIDSLANEYMDDWVGKLLDGLSIEKCAVVFSDRKLMEESYIAKTYATHKFYFWDIVYAKYSLLQDDIEIDPIDHDLLKKMGQYVDEIFWMMERCVDREFNHRWNDYCKHVRVWNHVLDSLNINLYICLYVPHDIYEYILYALCKIKGIPFIGLATTNFLGYSYFITDICDPLPNMSEYLGLLRKKYEKSSVKDIVLSDGLQKVFNFYYDKEDLTPYYMLEKEFKLDKNIPLIDKILRYKQILLRRGYFLLWVLRHFFDFHPRVYNQMCKSAYGTDIYREPEILFDFYNSHATFADYSKKFIYVPLSAQPESSTSPMAGRYVDLLHMVIMLSCCLPSGYFLYVKEHPTQIKKSRIYALSSYRTLSFYQHLLELKNVRLISFDEDTYKLIKNASAVATTTGTAGIEAIVNNKLFFTFGYYFMQYAPNAITIRTKEDCLKAMERMQCFNQNGEITKKEMKIYFKALENFLIKGLAYIESFQYKWLSTQEIEEGKRNLVGSFRDKIFELLGNSALKSS